MKTFYTLSASAKLIRTNKFTTKADAVQVGTYRAGELGLPVKVFEHKEAKDGSGIDQVCILICNSDGSAKKPQSVGREQEPMDNESAGYRNQDEAYVLLSSYQEAPITTYYLKSDVQESQAKEIEAAVGCSIGLYDSRTMHAYTDDTKSLKKLEEHLAQASIEVDRVKGSKMRVFKKDNPDLVQAALEAEEIAGAIQPIRVQASCGGKKLSVEATCQRVTNKASGKTQLVVHGDRRVLATVTTEYEAVRLMTDYTEQKLAEFLKRGTL